MITATNEQVRHDELRPITCWQCSKELTATELANYNETYSMYGPPECDSCSEAMNDYYNAQQQSRFEFPETRHPQIAALYLKLVAHEQNVRAFYDDPMTEYCGCVGDFAEDFDNRKRSIVCELYRLSQKLEDNKAFEFSCDMLEQWMP